MIQSLACNDTKDFFKTGKVAKRAGWQAISKVASRKLDMLDAAVLLRDLKVPPNNRLEELKENLKGYHSIRISDQWRIVFK